MRIRQLKINVATTDGNYGTSLEFPDGLVIVWADNSMGKSTCARAIIVALGMEAMLTTSQQELPLPPAMTMRLDSGFGEHAVLESEVLLEIENQQGERIVVQRTVKGSRDKNLITVHRGPALTSGGTFETADYFVNRGGSATRDAGFHHYLASFLGWELPTVQTYDGNQVPLYLQCILPFVMTEQTRGWSTIMPPVPTQFRIKDPHRRAIEFLLGMDAHRIALLRQELQLRKTQVETRWSNQIKRVRDLASEVGGIAQALPKTPVTSWPPEIRPSVAVPEGDQWIALGERVLRQEARYRELVELEIPRVAEIAESAQRELSTAEAALQARQALLSRLLEALESEEQEILRVRERLEVIEEDIKRNKDSKTLRSLGSRKESAVDHGACPVCHQAIADSLVPLAAGQGVMTLDENLEFLAEQRRTFAGVLAQSERIADARQMQVRATREEVGRMRDRVRHLRQTLFADGRVPSEAAIYERVDLDNQIKQDRRRLDLITEAIELFSGLAGDWKDIQERLVSLPSDDLTEDDRRKLGKWATSLREQLREYGFRSLNPSQIELSPYSYRPEHEGFDLQTTISASDLIRTIWAYLSGLLEVSRIESTNHPGCIVFDEPRQQSTRDVSFGALLKRAAVAGEYGQQIIFFTSEERGRLDGLLKGLPHTMRDVHGRVIKKFR
jgi:hypothetical protein